ncbi:hypothetical protein CWO04_15155 [Vibrio splendidus]|nr:hypothetical protein CWO04_15155 [Vibrio splendidus]
MMTFLNKRLAYVAPKFVTLQKEQRLSWGANTTTLSQTIKQDSLLRSFLAIGNDDFPFDKKISHEIYIQKEPPKRLFLIAVSFYEDKL